MCPTVKGLEFENFNEVEVSLGVLSESELAAIAELLPKLKDDLGSRWSVLDIRILRRNPHYVNQAEASILISLATAIITKLGEKLSTEAYDWMRHRLKHTAPKRKQRKRTRS